MNLKDLFPTIVFGVGGYATTLYKAYKRAEELKKTPPDVIRRLLDDGLAICTTSHSASRVIIAQEKTGLIGAYVSGTNCRVVITGRFLYKNQELDGFIGYYRPNSPKNQRKEVEEMGLTAITVVDGKVPMNSDYRELLKH